MPNVTTATPLSSWTFSTWPTSAGDVDRLALAGYDRLGR
jgi:hypothetical protein